MIWCEFVDWVDFPKDLLSSFDGSIELLNARSSTKDRASISEKFDTYADKVHGYKKESGSSNELRILEEMLSDVTDDIVEQYAPEAEQAIKHMQVDMGVWVDKSGLIGVAVGYRNITGELSSKQIDRARILALLTVSILTRILGGEPQLRTLISPPRKSLFSWLRRRSSADQKKNVALKTTTLWPVDVTQKISPRAHPCTRAERIVTNALDRRLFTVATTRDALGSVPASQKQHEALSALALRTSTILERHTQRIDGELRPARRDMSGGKLDTSEELLSRLSKRFYRTGFFLGLIWFCVMLLTAATKQLMSFWTLSMGEARSFTVALFFCCCLMGYAVFRMPHNVLTSTTHPTPLVFRHPYFLGAMPITLLIIALILGLSSLHDQLISKISMLLKPVEIDLAQPLEFLRNYWTAKDETTPVSYRESLTDAIWMLPVVGLGLVMQSGVTLRNLIVEQSKPNRQARIARRLTLLVKRGRSYSDWVTSRTEEATDGETADAEMVLPDFDKITDRLKGLTERFKLRREAARLHFAQGTVMTAALSLLLVFVQSTGALKPKGPDNTDLMFAKLGELDRFKDGCVRPTKPLDVSHNDATGALFLARLLECTDHTREASTTGLSNIETRLGKIEIALQNQTAGTPAQPVYCGPRMDWWLGCHQPSEAPLIGLLAFKSEVLEFDTALANVAKKLKDLEGRPFSTSLSFDLATTAFDAKYADVVQKLANIEPPEVSLTANTKDFMASLKTVQDELDEIDDIGVRIIALPVMSPPVRQAFAGCDDLGQYRFGNDKAAVSENPDTGEGWFVDQRSTTRRGVLEAATSAQASQRRIYVLGSADLKGSQSHNHRLSRARAKAVVEALQLNEGISDLEQPILLSAGPDRWLGGFELPQKITDDTYRSATVVACDSAQANTIASLLGGIFDDN